MIYRNTMNDKYILIKGKVIYGNQIGRTIGFRTANILYFNKNIKKGVYMVKVKYNSIWYNGIANYGTKPTVSNKNEYSLEVNIFDFDKNIYNEEIEVLLMDKLRDEIKFNSLNELKSQIETDVKEAKRKFTHIL